ncbi:unnamed protein product [Arabis nemorensis]|uniref:Uncharacterized protein n=1 Tax=Arabis nemorensis TaxID=586526 RepID=A0A565BJ69_9BRAS|nr:unnamed protein product [Arabis nemorensis]
MLSGTRPETAVEALRLQQMDLHRRLSISAAAVSPLSKPSFTKPTGVPHHRRLSGEIRKQREDSDWISTPLFVNCCDTTPGVQKILVNGGSVPARSFPTVATSPPQRRSFGELLSPLNHAPLSLAPAMSEPPDLLPWPDPLLVVFSLSSPLAPPDCSVNLRL